MFHSQLESFLSGMFVGIGVLILAEFLPLNPLLGVLAVAFGLVCSIGSVVNALEEQTGQTTK